MKPWVVDAKDIEPEDLLQVGDAHADQAGAEHACRREQARLADARGLVDRLALGGPAPAGRNVARGRFAVPAVAAAEQQIAHYAFVTDYLEFERPVSFRDVNHYFESALQRSDGGTNRGAFGRAVRFLPDREYELILAAGFSRLVTELSVTSETAELYEEPATFERPLIEQIALRPFRDQAFARAVQFRLRGDARDDRA